MQVSALATQIIAIKKVYRLIGEQERCKAKIKISRRSYRESGFMEKAIHRISGRKR